MHAPVEMEADQIVFVGVQNSGCVSIAEVLDRVFYNQGERRGRDFVLIYSLFACWWNDYIIKSGGCEIKNNSRKKIQFFAAML